MKFSRFEIWMIVLLVIGLIAVALIPMAGPWALLVFPVGIFLILVAGYETVPNNERWVIEIFGAYDRILGPGLHFLIRGIEMIRAKQPISEQHLDIRVSQTLTKDDVKVDLNTELFFVLKQDRNDPAMLERAVYDATYGVESDADGRAEGAIGHFAEATLRSTFGSRSFDDLTDDQAAINAIVISEMEKGVERWGQEIRRHAIKEFIPQPDVAATLLKKFTAAKEKIATELNADAKKYQDIRDAEAKQQERILFAEAKKQEEIKDAEGEAEGIRLRGEALGTPAGKAAAEYNLAEQAIAAATALAKTTNTVILPAGFADLAGLLKAGKSILEAPQPPSGSAG